jgi:hypothetical protein
MEDNIKIYFETGLEGVDWIRLAQDKVQWRSLAKTVMKMNNN